MDYKTASEILNRHIFDKDKLSLLRNIADHPERFIGLFRPTKPKAKILQNLLQSHEIRFGDALEELIKAMLHDLGYKILPEHIRDAAGNDLSIDQYFTDGSVYYFMEQKVRDDHDSTKKRGQISNFESKLDFLQQIHKQNMIGIMYFIDPDLIKNRAFYIPELSVLSQTYDVKLYLFYGPEFFTYLGHPELWQYLIEWLTQWKTELPDLPEINMDNSSDECFDEIRGLENRYWRKLISDERFWNEGIMAALSREGVTLRLILEYFREQTEAPYPKLAEGLNSCLQKYYPL